MGWHFQFCFISVATSLSNLQSFLWPPSDQSPTWQSYPMSVNLRVRRASCIMFRACGKPLTLPQYQVNASLVTEAEFALIGGSKRRQGCMEWDTITKTPFSNSTTNHRNRDSPSSNRYVMKDMYSRPQNHWFDRPVWRQRTGTHCPANLLLLWKWKRVEFVEVLPILPHQCRDLVEQFAILLVTTS